MPKNNYLGYVHSFRGFAILNIVAIHAIAVANLIPQNWDADNTAPLYILNETLFHDSTVYFAIISGLLFSSVLQSRGFQRFFRSKFLYVLLPYLFCTLVFTAQRWDSTGTGVLALPVDFHDYVNAVIPNFLNGAAQFTFWYIPVLLILFVLTPLLARLVAAKSHGRILLWGVMLLPLLFSRPPFEADIGQVTPGSVTYFAGAYTVGLYLGANLQTCLDLISKYRYAALSGAAIASALLVYLQMQQINRFGSFSLQESLYYVQKLCIAAIVLLWLRGRGEYQPQWLSRFADAAFSIYFLHAFFIMLVAHYLWDFARAAEFQPWSIYLLAALYFVAALALSMLVVKALHAVIGRRARLLVGS